MKNRKELEQYPIRVSQISSLPPTDAYRFEYINGDTVFIYGSHDLFEVNLTTNKWTRIIKPNSWNSNTSCRNLQYDQVTNSIHMLGYEYKRDSSSRMIGYYILRLDGYTWETIEELGDEIDNFHYDSINMLIYVWQSTVQENESGRRVINYITTYDLQRRVIINRAELPDDTYFVYLLYGNPLKVLASTRSKEVVGGLCYSIYDILTGTRVDYPEIILSYGFSNIDIVIPLNKEGCFLGIEYHGLDSSKIVEIDLNTKIIKTVALENFPYTIGNFKKIAQGKYAFIVSTPNRIGGPGPCFLCFMDLAYP